MYSKMSLLLSVGNYLLIKKKKLKWKFSWRVRVIQKYVQ
jgi:hypothetical protein